MNASVSGLGVALARLAALGFVPAPRMGNARCFDGTLACRAGPVRVRVQISDWDFVEYPVIRLLEHPAFLPAVTPHISGSGNLCYFQEGAVILDRYRPDHALAQCLERARDELDRLAHQPAYRDGEFQGEFSATWTIGQQPRADSLLLGNIDPGSDDARCFVVGQDESRRLLVASNPDDVKRLCTAAGWAFASELHAHCQILRSARAPSLPAKLPATIGEVFGWFKAWDASIFSSLQARLAQRDYLSAGAALFLVETPAGTFGFQFRLDPLKRKAYSRRPRLYRQFLHGRGRDQAIMRLTPEMVGVDYVHSRNLDHPSLKDRRVTLVGCGAIGGYVAQALVKLGAGTGNGNLVLVDPELLTGDNLGRHLLGFESLFRGKAEALRDALTRQFPAAQITCRTRRVDPSIDLDADLIVNATGEEAVGLMLNDRHQRLHLERRPPLLHAWIVGNGEAVQALWVDLPKFGCFRCLRQTDEARSERFRVLERVPETRVRGCRAFRPYAVSAPMAAAALATDLICGWLEGTPSPRFRTRLLESADVRRVKSQDLSPLDACPACRQ